MSESLPLLSVQVVRVTSCLCFVNQVWNEKLPLSEKTVKTKEEGGADEAYEKEAVGGLKLYRCAEEEGVLKVSEVKSGPLDRKDLDSGVILHCKI